MKQKRSRPMDDHGTDTTKAHRNKRQVVVTGLGVVSSIGIGRMEFTQALRCGKSVVSAIRGFDTSGYPYAHATEIHDLGDSQTDYDRLIETHGRAACFAILAAREAMQHAKLDSGANGGEIGVVLGTTNGESQLLDRIVRRWMQDGPSSVPAADWQNAPAHRIAHAVSRTLGLCGESLVLATACAAGNYAIGHAADVIEAGDADIMVCGGVDAVNRSAYSGFFRLNAVTPDVCRPFDAGRQGILTGEGAGVLVLESLDHARRRGAPFLAEILGYGLSCDANNMVAPQAESIARCIRTAHARAGVEPSDIDLISAHGTGTRTNDVVEVAAIRQVFGDAAPPTVSIKSMIGHTMGAASAMGAIACILGMQNDFIPPTVNFRQSDSACAIDCVPNHARRARLRVVENHGFAFGGNNGVLIMRNGRDMPQLAA
jgi:3-oxoacyl-[acyl-carrier-protein] synthase II